MTGFICSIYEVIEKLIWINSLNKSLQEYRDYIKNEYRENIQKENSLVNTTNE